MHEVKQPIVCLQVLRSIGYKTLPVDKDIPFDPKKGIIPNLSGKVLQSKLRSYRLSFFSYLPLLSLSLSAFFTDNEVVQGKSEQRIKLLLYFHKGNKNTC